MHLDDAGHQRFSRQFVEPVRDQQLAGNAAHALGPDPRHEIGNQLAVVHQELAQLGPAADVADGVALERRQDGAEQFRREKIPRRLRGALAGQPVQHLAGYRVTADGQVERGLQRIGPSEIDQRPADFRGEAGADRLREDATGLGGPVVTKRLGETPQHLAQPGGILVAEQSAEAVLLGAQENGQARLRGRDLHRRGDLLGEGEQFKRGGGIKPLRFGGGRRGAGDERRQAVGGIAEFFEVLQHVIEHGNLLL